MGIEEEDRDLERTQMIDSTERIDTVGNDEIRVIGDDRFERRLESFDNGGLFCLGRIVIVLSTGDEVWTSANGIDDLGSAGRERDDACWPLSNSDSNTGVIFNSYGESGRFL